MLFLDSRTMSIDLLVRQFICLFIYSPFNHKNIQSKIYIGIWIAKYIKTDKMDGLPISESLTEGFCSSVGSINIIIYSLLFLSLPVSLSLSLSYIRVSAVLTPRILTKPTMMSRTGAPVRSSPVRGCQAVSVWHSLPPPYGTLCASPYLPVYSLINSAASDAYPALIVGSPA